MTNKMGGPKECGKRPGDLLEKAKKDRNAFPAFLEEVQKQFFGIALAKLGNKSDAEDAIQDAMLKIFLNIKRYDPDKDRNRKAGWAFRILWNCANDIGRRKAKQLTVERHSIEDIANAPLYWDGADPSADAEGREDKNLLQTVLEQLSAQDREVLALAYWGNLTIKESAEVLDIPPGTVASRVARARNKLQSILEPFWSQLVNEKC